MAKLDRLIKQDVKFLLYANPNFKNFPKLRLT